MAEKIMLHPLIHNASDLVTPHDRVRAGFIAMALEKNYLAVPYIEEAKTLRALAGQAANATAIIQIPELRVGLLTAAGLSDKALSHIDDEAEDAAIQVLVEKFLLPAGNDFVDELIFRFLLTKGDALGGRARNLAGTLGERKLLRNLLSFFSLAGMNYQWKDSDSGKWLTRPDDDTDIEKRIKSLCWKNKNGNRLLVMNTTIPIVGKNIDASLLNGTQDELTRDKTSIIYSTEKFIALGELKGGFDPAGADEHWKTACKALERIRTGFRTQRLSPLTFFVGAAIESSMAKEIFKEIKNSKLSNAANLTNDEQMISLSEWLISL